MTGGWPGLLIISGQGVQPVGSVFGGCGVRFSIKTGSKFGNKNSFAKKFERSNENSPSQAKIFLGFVKHFSEFAKGIYETCDCNFFNLALVVFSIVQFILFLCFASNN